MEIPWSVAISLVCCLVFCGGIFSVVADNRTRHDKTDTWKQNVEEKMVTRDELNRCSEKENKALGEITQSLQEIRYFMGKVDQHMKEANDRKRKV